MYDENAQIQRAIQAALEEDIGSGDVTSTATLPENLVYNGRFLAKAPGIIAGLNVAEQVFKAVDERILFSPLVKNGTAVSPQPSRKKHTQEATVPPLHEDL